MIGASAVMIVVIVVDVVVVEDSVCCSDLLLIFNTILIKTRERIERKLQSGRLVAEQELMRRHGTSRQFES